MRVFNFSCHKLDERALAELIPGATVIGSLPVVSDIGNYDSVKSAVKAVIAAALQVGPDYVFVSAHPAFEKLIHQGINQFQKLHVPHLMWDTGKSRFWIAPPPLTRVDRQEIEFDNMVIPEELAGWYADLMKGVVKNGE